MYVMVLMEAEFLSPYNRIPFFLKPLPYTMYQLKFTSSWGVHIGF